MKGQSLLACLFLGLSCAPAGAQDKIRVVNEGGIRDEWSLASGTKLPVPAHPPAYAGHQGEVCVAIGYLINPDGTTSDFSLLKAWSAVKPERDREEFWSAFGREATAALSQWRFVPRAEVAQPRPVFTVATFLFATAAPVALKVRCQIPSLVPYMRELRHDTRVQRRMGQRDIYSKLELDLTREERMRADNATRHEAHLQDFSRAAAEMAPPPPPPPPPGGGG